MFTFTSLSPGGQVMEADGAGKANPAFPAASNGHLDQQWQIIEVTYTPADGNFTPRYEIRNASSGQVLQDDGGTLDQASAGGANQETCAGSTAGDTSALPADQVWQFVSVSSDTGEPAGLMLRNICTGNVAEVSAGGTSLGTAKAATPPALGQQWALTEVPSFWAYSSEGNVYNQDGTPWFGSLGNASPPVTDVAGLAATQDGTEYWLVESDGTVTQFNGTTPVTSSITTSCSGGFKGAAPDPAGGYYAFTACGNVDNEAGAIWHGSLASANPGLNDVTGIAATPDGQGYWLVESGGTVSHFGDATSGPGAAAGVIGAAGNPNM